MVEELKNVEKAELITEDIYWVGFADLEAGFSNNPYLIVDPEMTILIDPGPGYLPFWNIIRKKIESVISSITNIDLVIVHHQDPDLCAAIPLIEKIIGVNNFEIMTTWRSSLFIRYYGVDTEVTPIEDGDALELSNGRQLEFITTPYLHFPGAVTTYDTKTKTLFSSDIFGAFSSDWSLYANEYYHEAIKAFSEPYFGSVEAIKYAVRKFRKLELERICPQHGSIIDRSHGADIAKYLDLLESIEAGKWME
ncbi:MAG: MBL fold metallo-hydrolase [Candidatus Hodarchaeales archaeon]